MTNIKKYEEFILENYSLILENIDWNKSKDYFDKLAKNYKFLWITPEMMYQKGTEVGLSNQPNEYQVMSQVKTLKEVIPDGQFGYIMFNPRFSNITLIGNEKGVLKQMQNDIIKNYSSFSDTEHLNKGIGHDKKDWTGASKSTNAGSKGTVAVMKAADKDSGKQMGLQTYTKPDGMISVATIQLG